MKTIDIRSSKTYPVMIGNRLLESFGPLATEYIKPCKAAIISDSNVWPLYGAAIRKSLLSAGFQVINYVIPAGESSKNGGNYLSILNFLADYQLTRSDLLIALGGGVVGDITGFVAATYLRGISYIQVPTSLLAMVDSSVGGKTAIDLPSGKNLVGAFYQPIMVICDLDVLSSLPQNIFLDGCAEIIKYGILFDEVLFSHLETHGCSFDRQYVIGRCIELKRDVVGQDEFDIGQRQMLNLGHTIGHGIERHSSYRISHGMAVAAGMAITSRAAAQLQICHYDTAKRMCNLLTKFSLPIKTDYTSEQLFHAALSDKKRTGGTINLIVPVEIGRCEIRPTDIIHVESFIEAGM